MPEQLEERVALLEAEVARLKRLLLLQSDSSQSPWWRKIAGRFASSSAYDEAIQLGREYRESLRSSSPESFDE
jgi:ribosomal protein L18E